jgi:hypothetical protein
LIPQDFRSRPAWRATRRERRLNVANRFGQAEIGNFDDPISIDEQIVTLEIAMQDFARVKISHALASSNGELKVRIRELAK